MDEQDHPARVHLADVEAVYEQFDEAIEVLRRERRRLLLEARRSQQRRAAADAEHQRFRELMAALGERDRG